MNILNYSIKYLMKYNELLFVYLIVNLGLIVVTVISPYISGRIVNILTSTSDLEYLYSHIALIGVVWIVDIILGFVNNVVGVKLRIDSTYSMRSDIIHHIHACSFFKVNSVDPMYLNQRINQDTGSCINFAINIVTNVLFNTITAIAMLVLMFSISNKITYILILLIAIYYCAYIIIKTPLSVYAKKYKEAQNLFFAKMGEQIRHTKFVKLHSLKKFFEDRLKNYYEHFRTTNLQFRKLIYLLSSIDGIVKCAANMALFLIGGNEIISGNMTVGMFLVVSSYFTKIINSLSYYFQLGKMYQDAMVSYNRIKEILDWEKEIYGNYVPQRIDEIRLSNFSFSYNDKKVLSNLSLCLKRGHIYGIIGPNGTGKSTFIQAISGLFLNNAEGDILINGIPIKECDVYKIREKFYSIVEQEPLLLNDSIEMNLFFNKSTNLELTHKIYKLLGLDSYLNSLPNGIYTVISSTNSNISGGEKQKLSLARALLKDSEVIILDEPTSALDKNISERFLQYIQSITKNKILIVVSHDSRLINICDYVIDFEEIK